MRAGSKQDRGERQNQTDGTAIEAPVGERQTPMGAAYLGYLRDPDGNEVEVYVDADESLWKTDPAAVVSPIKPLHL